jgi:hypothetical protein
VICPASVLAPLLPMLCATAISWVIGPVMERAVWMALAVGVPLLLAASLAFWAVPRLLRR